jgi:6-phosphofructokinase 1
MGTNIRRIAINTGGGDAPGLNAVIRATVLAAQRRGWEVVGIRKGYHGFLQSDGVVPLDRSVVRGIAHLGGTILGTTNRGNPFEWPIREPDGSISLRDRSGEVVERFEQLGLDALVAIGGDGSMQIASRFADLGLPIVGVPKTIDNDLVGTVTTFGFHTAVSISADAVGRLHSTAESHERVFVVEVMGRYAGWIALHAGIGGGADVILIPEIPYSIEAVCEKVRQREARGRRFSMIVIAEGAREVEGEISTREEASPGEAVRLGGAGEKLAAEIATRTGKETRTVVLGHLQRAGGPVAYDRVIAQRFGAAAVKVIARGEFSVMVALDPPDILTVALSEVSGRMKLVPLDCDTVESVREMGICLGD